MELPEFQQARHVKINPDSPQRPVREHLLEQGVTLFAAVPRLADAEPFLRLEPDCIPDPSDAVTLDGMEEFGQPVHPTDMPEIDAIVTGSVAVDRNGGRLGKGEGYSDLELALLVEWDLVDSDVPIWTSVHPLQVQDSALPAQEAHDLSLSGVVTSDEVFRFEESSGRPSGLDPARLSDEQREEIPILREILEGA